MDVQEPEMTGEAVLDSKERYGATILTMTIGGKQVVAVDEIDLLIRKSGWPN